MSVQAGVLYRGRTGVRADLAVSIKSELSRLAPDSGGEYVTPEIVMIYRALHITPEDLRERQPVTSHGGCVVTWDGRLDNREDLLTQLWRHVGKEATDAELAVAAYERWRHDGLARLVGDWSMVIWDGTSKELTLASDFAGNRPLYFTEFRDEVHWSTSLAELVQRLGFHEDIDPRYVIGYLGGSIPSGVTPYRQVGAVLPGHALSWKPGRPMIPRRFWDFVPGRIRYADARDYEAHLRSLFAEAVRARLRSRGPVWAELSGGLDSSSVVCMADRLLACKRALASAVETVSFITDTSPESDERPFIAAVEQQRGKAGHYVTMESCCDLFDERGWASPEAPTGTRLALFRIVTEHHGRVLLSGIPGDLVMMNYPLETGGITDAFAARRFMTSMIRAHEWCHASHRTMWQLLYQLVTQTSWPGEGRRALRKEIRSDTRLSRNIITLASDAYNFTQSAAETWIAGALAQWTRVAHIRPSATRRLVKGLYDMTEWSQTQTPSGMLNVTYSHPYLDRPLVDFVLSVPTSVMCRPGQPRLLMKAAWSEILPPRVANRFSKGTAAPANARAIRSWMPGNLAEVDKFYLVRAGYVDRDRLRNALQSVRSGNCLDIRNLTTIATFERWVATRHLRHSCDERLTKGGEQLCTTSPN